MGIPRGNTVALAGDPGTGKTTFLLTFFRYGRHNSGQGISLGNQGLMTSGQTDAETRRALQTFDSLIRTTTEHDRAQLQSTDPNGEPRGTLRCFISLESSFHRIRNNHPALMRGAPRHTTEVIGAEAQPGAQAVVAPMKGNTIGDLFVFIDATAFLSGRLEDQLRYPRLKDAAKDRKKEEDWDAYEFSLGGYETQSDFSVLYWQPRIEAADAPDKPPVRIDQIHEESSPFARNDRAAFRLFTLATMPIPDPMKRIRLLKDLLAELFASVAGKYEILVAIDSLSALLSTFGLAEVGPGTAGGRRLHVINLVRWFEENDVTSLMACEAVRESGQTLRRQPLFLGTQERYIASGVIQFDYHQYRSGDLIRYFRILKMRGAGHDMRPHAYELGPNGIAWIEPLYAEPEMEGSA